MTLDAHGTHDDDVPEDGFSLSLEHSEADRIIDFFDEIGGGVSTRVLVEKALEQGGVFDESTIESAHVDGLIRRVKAAYRSHKDPDTGLETFMVCEGGSDARVKRVHRFTQGEFEWRAGMLFEKGRECNAKGLRLVDLCIEMHGSCNVAVPSDGDHAAGGESA